MVRLLGDGREGIGEDVGYDGEDQLAFQRRGADLDLAGRTTFDAFSRGLDDFALQQEPRDGEASRLYRRWAFEAAALDLALAQAGRSLGGVLGIEPRPASFVVSTGLGDPPSLDALHRRLARYPDLRFKLDCNDRWTPELIAELAATGRVAVVDLKGHYHGSFTGPDPDPATYRRLAEGLPEAWIEDPALGAEMEPLMRTHERRLAWDAPIHSRADLVRMPVRAAAVNMKPSRFGFLSELLAAYDYCREHGIVVYGGGQFELGPGRGQIQYLASLLHPDAPNDVAPPDYNQLDPPDGLPASPLRVAASEYGFRWES